MKILLLVCLLVIDLFQTAHGAAVCKGCVRVSMTCDNDLIWFYADGKAVLSWKTPHADDWHQTKSKHLKRSPKVYGVQCKDRGVVAGILMSADDGTVSNGEWRCTTEAPSGTKWLKPGFDDSCWERATVSHRNLNAPNWGTRPGISTSAYWIWTKNWKGPIDDTVYCRLDKTVARIGITCDNGLLALYADGKLILDKYSPKANDWGVTKYATVPKTTKVFAVICKDWGVKAGMLMSASDGTVTDRSWRCTTRKPRGKSWLKSGFNDSRWEQATAIARNNNAPDWGTRPGISTNAYWIWTRNWSGRTIDTPVYCRKAK